MKDLAMTICPKNQPLFGNGDCSPFASFPMRNQSPLQHVHDQGGETLSPMANDVGSAPMAGDGSTSYGRH
jgi:hypothetical protein